MMVPKEKRRERLQLRMTESEMAIIAKKMEALGIKNESAFVRSMVLNGYILKLDVPEIRELIRLLQNMTNNLNQIAKRVNTGGNIYETELEEIKDNQRTLWDIMNRILKQMQSNE